MDMLAALIGYGGFVLSVTLLSLVCYWKADSLEAWTRKFVAKKRNRG